MSNLFFVLGGWIALNLALPIAIYYQRSPHLRHVIFRYTVGGLSPFADRWRAHRLVVAAHQHHH